MTQWPVGSLIIVCPESLFLYGIFIDKKIFIFLFAFYYTTRNVVVILIVPYISLSDYRRRRGALVGIGTRRDVVFSKCVVRCRIFSFVLCREFFKSWSF
jgi:hypothetical protein